MFGSFHHQNVTVSDIARSKAFYTGLLGLEVIDEVYVDEPAFGEGVGIPGAAVHALFLKVPGQETFIEMLQYEGSGPDPVGDRGPDAVGLGHLALEVSDIEEVHGRLSEAGVEFVSKPVTMSNGVRWCYFRDPDGILLELIQPTGDSR